MNPFFEYLIKSSLSLALFYIVFKLAVSREKMHTINRFVLLGILFVSAVIPFADFPVFGKTEIITIPKVEEVREVAETPVFVAPETAPILNVEQTVVAPETVQINWLLTFYLIAVSLLVLWLVISIIKVTMIIGNAEKQRLRKIILAVAKEVIQPFSFLKYIVISEKDYTENRNIVVAHEQAHIQHYHSADLIICELFTLLHWFNPFMWLLHHDLKLIHEFQADQTVLNKGIDAKKYQLLVLQKSVGERRFAMANHFAQKPILKRLKMMQNRDRKKWNAVKLIVFVPLILLLLQAFAKPDIIIGNENKMKSGFFQQPNDDLAQQQNRFSPEEKNSVKKPFLSVSELPDRRNKTKVEKEFSKKEEVALKEKDGDAKVFSEQKKVTKSEATSQIKAVSDIAKACTVVLSNDLLFVDDRQTTLNELKIIIEEKIEQSKNLNTVELRVFEGTSESRIEDVNSILNRIAGLTRIIKTTIPPAPAPIYISINSSGELKVGNDRFTSYDEFEDRLIEIKNSVKKKYKATGGTQYLVANVKVKAGVSKSEVGRLKESLQKVKLLHVNYFQEKTDLQNSNCNSEYFGDGLLKTFSKNGKVGLSTKSGNRILANEYDDISLYGNYIKTYKDGKYGLYSKTGNVILKNEFVNIQFYGNYIKTYKDSKYGLYSKTGNVILKNEFVNIQFYGNYIKTYKDSKYGLYSKTGNVVLKNEFVNIQFYGNYIKTYKDGKYGLYSKTGNVILKNEFVNIQFYGNYIKTYKDGKYGLYSKTGNVILKNEYDNISQTGSYFKTVKNGKTGLADSRGNIVIPNEYDKLEVNGKKVRLVKNGIKKTITL